MHLALSTDWSQSIILCGFILCQECFFLVLDLSNSLGIEYHIILLSLFFGILEDLQLFLCFKEHLNWSSIIFHFHMIAWVITDYKESRHHIVKMTYSLLEWNMCWIFSKQVHAMHRWCNLHPWWLIIEWHLNIYHLILKIECDYTILCLFIASVKDTSDHEHVSVEEESLFSADVSPIHIDCGVVLLSSIGWLDYHL